MRVTSKGQVTIPQNVRENIGIIPAETEVDFVQEEETGRWFIVKVSSGDKTPSRFRTAHALGKLKMTTDEIMALTRSDE
jgi:bifunctional DNA-binding transcriptional regulator/antitoxin component of YhaV-PrlF toxin-antitoxin module